MNRLALSLVGVLVVLSSVGWSADYGDITTNGSYWLGGDERWDLTACDLTISYTLDMSGYVPPMWSTAWSSVGVGEGASGWMSSGAPAAAETNPNNQDIDDKLNLGAPDRYDEASYDATDPETLVTPPIGNPWINYGIWFDRDGVDPYQALMWGMVDGVTYNTGGVYDVVVTYHAIDSTAGTMFATVNSVQTGFYDSWKNAPPDHSPVGKSITGDLSELRVFASIWGENVNVYDLTVQGCPYRLVQIVIEPETLNLKSKGVFTAFIDLPEGYGEEDVDIGTVECEGAPAVKAMMADDNRLIVKFDREDLVGVSTGDEVELTVMGDMTDGTHFKGSDTVRVID